MKQKPINEIEEASANKTIATFTSLAGMAEMKAIIGMIARDAARNTTLSLRNEGYFSEPKVEPSPKVAKAAEAQRVDEAIEAVASLFEGMLSGKADKSLDSTLSNLAGVLFSMGKKPNA